MAMDMETMRRRLLAKAFLYDDPASYVCGVEQALSAVQKALTARPQTEPAAQRPALERHLSAVRTVGW
jgi:hypothetical protein